MTVDLQSREEIESRNPLERFNRHDVDTVGNLVEVKVT